MTTQPKQLELFTTAYNALGEAIAYMQQQSPDPVTDVTGEMTATTAEVNWITKQSYDWCPLRRWCRDHNIEIEKADYFGMMLNDYPASAWQAVYGLDIVKLFPLRK